MSSRRYANFFVLGVTFLVFLTFSKSSGTLVRRSAHKGHEMQRRTAGRYHHATVNDQVYHTQWRMTTTSKPKLKQKQYHFNGKKYWKYATNVTLQLNGWVASDKCSLQLRSPTVKKQVFYNSRHYVAYSIENQPMVQCPLSFDSFINILIKYTFGCFIILSIIVLWKVRLLENNDLCFDVHFFLMGNLLQVICFNYPSKW